MRKVGLWEVIEDLYAEIGMYIKEDRINGHALIRDLKLLFGVSAAEDLPPLIMHVMENEKRLSKMKNELLLIYENCKTEQPPENDEFATLEMFLRSIFGDDPAFDWFF